MVSTPDKKTPADIAPTNYWFSALVLAVMGSVGSVVSLLVPTAMNFAIWRFFIAKSLRVPQLPGLGVVWVSVLLFYAAGLLTWALFPTDPESAAQWWQRPPFLMLPFVLMILAQSNGPTLRRWSVLGAVAGAFIACAYALVEAANGVPRAMAINGNPNVFGHTATLQLVIIGLGIVSEENKRVRLLCWAAVPVILTTIMLSGSRGSLLAAILVCVTYIWFCSPWQSVKQRLLAISTICLFATIFIVATPFGARFVTSFQEIVSGDISYAGATGARLAIWQCGLAAGMDAPVFGEGHSNSLRDLQLCLREEFSVPQNFTHFHNLVIDQFAKGGLVGVAATLPLLFLPLVLLRIWRVRGIVDPATQTGKALVAAILSLFLVQFVGASVNLGFGHDIIDSSFVYMLALLFGLAFACRPVLKNADKRPFAAS